MIIKTVTAILLAASIAAAPAVNKDKKPKEVWKDLGECRITSYCPYCNDGSGHESSSGKELRYGYAACSWLPIGTKISIEGEIFTIVAVCGTDAIDVFIDHDEGYCGCTLNEYRNVAIKEKRK